MGVSLARSVELSVQWDKDPLGLFILLPWIHAVLGAGLCDFQSIVRDVHRGLCDFIHTIIVLRRDEALRGWRNWLLEDPLCTPLKWLTPDLVPLSLISLGSLLILLGLMKNSEKAWLPFFCRSGQREASLEEFALEVDGWLPVLPVVDLPRLTGEMLEGVVRRRSATSGCLDGLASILSKVEEVGRWTDGLLDAFFLP